MNLARRSDRSPLVAQPGSGAGHDFVHRLFRQRVMVQLLTRVHRRMRLYAAPSMRLLRATMLALLVLGIMVRPVLGVIGELHVIEHASLASGTDSQGNGLDPDHALGVHGLLHQGCGNADSTLPASLDLTALPLAPAVLPFPATAPPGGAYVDLPFRPPIA